MAIPGLTRLGINISLCAVFPMTAWFFMVDPQSTPHHEGRTLGYVIIAVFGLLQLAVIATEEPVRYLFNGLGMIYVGGLFLISYFHEQRSFVFRALMTFCTRIAWPRSRKMAFFFFALPTVLGTISLIAGITVLVVPVLQSATQ